MFSIIDPFLAKIFDVQVQSQDMEHLHSALTIAFFIGISIYIYIKRYEAAKLRKNTSRYIDERRHDMNQLIFQTEIFLKNAPQPHLHLTLDGEDETSTRLRMLLSRFETLAEDVKLGLVSETHVRDSYSTTIINLMDFAKKYIYLYRINTYKKSAFGNIEGLYIRLKYRRDSIIQNIIEWIINRKMYATSLLIFRLKYYVISDLFSLNTNYMKEENDDIQAIVHFGDVALHFLLYSSIIVYMFWLA